MATGHDLVHTAMRMRGKPYVFGAEVNLNDPNPRAFDCSELIEWACAQIGVRFPDGSWNQIAACSPISVDRGIKTPGALLYRPGHIVISRGDNTTIEAKGRAYGVGVFSALGRFTHAGLIPALVYGSSPAPVDLAAIARAIAQAKTQTLRNGSRGDAVKWAQAGINNISGRGLAVDGIFGAATDRAVRDLQRLFGVVETGVVDAALWAVIFPTGDATGGTRPISTTKTPASQSNELAQVAASIRTAKSKVLRRGSKGDAVKWLQLGINTISGRGLAVDGVFGLATDRAVRDLQAWFRLSVDGIVGPKTWVLIYP